MKNLTLNLENIYILCNEMDIDYRKICKYLQVYKLK